MSRLIKLQLSGIRSFGPYEENVQHLKFETPLTLILGENGCGKTTIIEAIRYACTGDLPAGTDNGKGFLHDPKMCGASNVMGQVKLRFLDHTNNQITISRSAEVSTTAKVTKFATKSVAMRSTAPDGTDSSLGGRCGDLTAECCLRMNVSASVLGDVIFCHQENSFWPLEEGKKVKEKFDKIFEADKYRACIDTMRKEIKEQQGELKVLRVQLDATKDKKLAVEGQYISVRRKEDAFNELTKDIILKNAAREPIQSRLDKILDLEEVLSDLSTRLTSKEATREAIVQEQLTIKKRLVHEFQGTDQELASKLTSFETDREKEKKTIEQMEQRRTELVAKSKSIGNVLQQLQTNLGKLNQEQDHQAKKCQERTSSMVKLQSLLDIITQGDFDDNASAKAALGAFKAKLDTLTAAFVQMKQDQELEEKNLQGKIDGLRVAVAEMNQEKSSKQKRAREYETRIDELCNEFLTLSSSDEALRRLAEQIQESDKVLASMQTNFNVEDENKQLEKIKKTLQCKEQKLELYEKEYRLVQKNEVTQVQIQKEISIKEGKESDVIRIKQSNDRNLRVVFNDAIPTENFKLAVEAALNHTDAVLRRINEKITEKRATLASLQTQKQHEEQAILAKGNELRVKEAQIRESCEGLEFNAALAEVYQRKQKHQHDKGVFASSKLIFEKFIRGFRSETPCCPVCDTDFNGKRDAVQRIIDNLNHKVLKLPQQLKQAEDELLKAETRYNKLQQLKFVNEDVHGIREKLPQLRDSLEKVVEKIAGCEEDLLKLNTDLMAPRKIVSAAKSLISEMTTLDKSAQDIVACKEAIKKLEAELIPVEIKLNKLEIESLMDEYKMDISVSWRKIDAKTKQISNHKDRVQAVTHERMDLVQKQSDITKNLQLRPALEKEQEDLKEKLNQLMSAVARLDSLLVNSEEDLKSAIENRVQMTKSASESIEEERTRLINFSNLLNELNALQREIDDYINAGKAELLKTMQHQLQELRDKDEKIDSVRTTLINEITRKKEEVAKEELNFRSLQDNVLLREKKALERSLHLDIEALRREIGEHDYKSIYEEKRDLVQKREKFDQEINTMEGEKKAMKSAIEELQMELNKSANKNAEQIYLDKFYEVKVTESVISDVGRYATCLEKSVIDFHKTKLTQINKTIRELWRDIYKGNDIDYIEIQTAHSTGGARRTYNYKVVQVKKGNEFDMRGRCSAGQRVLACLIIRIALAETLCANCGILALDEPTTNLDRANIEGLSEALIRLVNSRQMDRNFQLLIITHDAEFINSLSRAEGVSHYYLIERDHNGMSTIRRQYAG